MSYAPKPDQPWHYWDNNQVIAKLETSEQGLSYAIARKRLRDIGRNLFAKDPKLPDLLVEVSYDPRVWGIVLSAIILQWSGELGWVVLLALGFTLIFAIALKFWIRELQTKATLARWSYRKPDPTSIVLRDQEWMEISSRLVVPGDFILVQAGDHPAGDVRLLSASPDLCADETMIGNLAIAPKQAETHVEVPAPPSQRSNMIYAGSEITEGFGTGLVVATGKATYWQSQIAPTQFLPKLSRELAVVAISALIVGIFALTKGWSYSVLLVTALVITYGAVPPSLLDQLLLHLGIKCLAQQRIKIRDCQVIKKLARVDGLELLPSQTAIKLDHRLFSQLKIQLTSAMPIDVPEVDSAEELEDENPSATAQANAVYGSDIADLSYLDSAYLSFSDRRCPVPIQHTVGLVLPRPDLRYLYTAITVCRHLSDRLNRLHLFWSSGLVGLLILVTAGAIASLPLVPLQIIWLGAIATPILCSCFLLEPITPTTSKPAKPSPLPLLIAILATAGSTLALFILKYQGQAETLISARTMAFTTFFLSQGFHAIALTRASLLEHWILPLCVCGLASAQVLLVQFAVFADAMGTVPLGTAEWLIVTFASTSVLWAQEIMRQA